MNDARRRLSDPEISFQLLPARAQGGPTDQVGGLTSRATRAERSRELPEHAGERAEVPPERLGVLIKGAPTDHHGVSDVAVRALEHAVEPVGEITEGTWSNHRSHSEGHPSHSDFSCTGILFSDKGFTGAREIRLDGSSSNFDDRSERLA
jgi:hypothetical protein